MVMTVNSLTSIVETLAIVRFNRREALLNLVMGNVLDFMMIVILFVRRSCRR